MKDERNQTEQFQDYKYIMQEFSTMFIGAKYTYDELIEGENIPFKLKNLANRYMKPELSQEDCSIESHLYYMEGRGFAYQTYVQLKTRVKFNILTVKKDIKGREKRNYTTKTLKIQDFVRMPIQEKEKKGVFIQEIAISKLALAMLS